MARRQEDWQHLMRELRAEFLLREEELELLHAIDLRLLEGEAYLDDTLSFITNSTKALLHSEHVSILLKRGPVLEVTHSSDDLDIGKRISIPGSIVGKVLTERRPVYIEDLAKSSLNTGYVPIAGYLGTPISSLIEVPIMLRGNPIGVFCVESAKTSAFRRVHTGVMEAIAAQAAVALQNGQHFGAAALFADVDQMIISQGDSQQVIQHVLQRVMEELRKLYRVELSGAQIFFRKGDDELEIVYSSNPDDVGLVLSIHESVSGRAVKERQTVTLDDVRKEPKYVALLGSNIRSEIAVPITLAADGAIIGVLNVESDEPDAFSGYNTIVIESFADKVRSLLAFAKLRNDVTAVLESRHANDLLIAIGDQTSNFIHRLNNSAGALRVKILELQETVDEGVPDKEILKGQLDELLRLAERTLEMPAQVTRFLGQGGITIDVNKCITDVLHEANPPARITVGTELQDELPELSLYSFDIVVQNLVKNAIDAMPNGGHLTVSTKLVTHADAPAGYVQLLVRDTGTGIPEEILPHIFDLNFTTKSKKQGKGLGLGLWWVRAFITRSHGEITVETEKNAGTEFSVKIPVATPLGSRGTVSE
jgi:signal transduction histidine kinase